MATTQQQLATRALEVRNETQTAHNTAQRVGQLFYDIILWVAGLFAGKQDRHDEGLDTSAKDIVPAINEVKRIAEEEIINEYLSCVITSSDGSMSITGVKNEISKPNGSKAINQFYDLRTGGIGGNLDTSLSIHAPVNSANILDALCLTGVAINRNCDAIAVIDKEDGDNFLLIELPAPGEQEDIDFSQFCGKSVYILAAGSGSNGGETEDLDLTLILKNK